jgi:membrane associated rhomboid family serine protease
LAAGCLITYQFLHINFGHVFANMIVLFVFGDDIEEVLGHWRFRLSICCAVWAPLLFSCSDR